MRKSAERIFDEYLAASARAGERAAFDRLVTRWQPKLLSHAYRLTGDAEVARDVVQDSWRDIVRSLPHLKDATTFPAWAFRIVTRRTADRIRNIQRERKINAAYAAEPKSTTHSADAIETSADTAPLNAALANLPAEQKAVIALHYREGFSVAEIAATLEVPAGTVKTRLMHARRKLRDALEGGNTHE